MLKKILSDEESKRFISDGPRNNDFIKQRASLQPLNQRGSAMKLNKIDSPLKGAAAVSKLPDPEDST